MAYLEQAVSNLSSVPALIRAFAVARGWTSDGSNGIQRPDSLSAPIWEILATIGTANHDIEIRDKANPTTRRAFSRLPKFQGSQAAPDVQLPTKLHLFGNDSPWEINDQVAPYIVAVIECGYNLYRHLYIGSMVKIGDYDDGDVISATWFNDSVSTSTANPTTNSAYSTSNKYPFQARHALTAPNPGGVNSGGVLITHADNPVPWRQFDGPTGTSCRTNFVGTEVLGGHGDSHNDGLVRRGVSSYAGSNILVPVNLLAPNNLLDANVRFHPIGHVAGVRMIDHRGINPGDSIEVGGDPWRVFPVFSKQTFTTVRSKNPGFWWDGESSEMLGMAYPE